MKRILLPALLSLSVPGILALPAAAECPSCFADSTSDATTPNMMGDGSLGIPLIYSPPFSANWHLIPGHYTKISDNNNVLPETRVGVGFRQYIGVTEAVAVNGGAVSNEIEIREYRIHMEKALCGGRFSLQATVPLYDTIDREINSTTAGATTGELGAVAFGVKALLLERESFALSAGLQAEAPTERDLSFFFPGIDDASIDYDVAWYLTPYLGWQYTPDECWFATGFFGFRAGTADHRLDPAIGGFDYIQPDRVTIDAAVGRWLWRNDDRRCLVTGLAPTAELHYTGYTENVFESFFTGEAFRDDIAQLNVTAGATAELSTGGSLAFGVVAPLLSDVESVYGVDTGRSMDVAFSIQYNQRW